MNNIHRRLMCVLLILQRPRLVIIGKQVTIFTASDEARKFKQYTENSFRRNAVALQNTPHRYYARKEFHRVSMITKRYEGGGEK